MKKQLLLQGSNLKFELASKTNWLPFAGTCLFTDTPSDGIPSGGIDKPVAFPKEEVQKALGSMVDMGVNCRFPDGFFSDPSEVFCGHDSRFKIGTVKTSDLTGSEMVISGGLWDLDFEDVCNVYRSAKSSLGFSVEVLFNIDDMGDYYNAKDIEFIGVAILFSDRAAFKKTYIAAQNKNKKKGADAHMELTKEELQTMLNTLVGNFTQELQKTNSQVEQLAVAFAEQRAEEKTKVEAEEAAAKEQAELATKKAEEEKLAKEAEEKAKAELEEKQKKEAEELEVKRKSLSFGVVHGRFEGRDDKQKAILSDGKLNPSQKFQGLIENYEAK